jgi:hypothetical protein
MMKMRILASAVVIACGLAAEAGAQTVMMEKAVVSTGGGTTTNGATTLNATIAQPVAGMATNGSLTGMFGFWTNAQVAAGVGTGAGAGSIADMTVSPNPVGDMTSVEVRIAQRGPVEVTLHDVQGRLVTTLHSSMAEAGTLRLPLDASGLASGAYYVAVSMPGSLLQRQVTVVR